MTSPATRPPVVVIGAGLAGLSTAFHLEAHRRVVLLEREDRVGGLTRSFHVGEFVFDVTGHLLHLKRREIRNLVDRLLPGEMGRIERRSFVYSHGAYTDYPFQANLHGLPADVVRECVVGFAEAWAERGSVDAARLALGSFHDWALALFGRGIAEHFLFPYNRKLWCRDLGEITADWVSWAVPRPTLDEVVGGALGRSNRGLGYNPVFHYPVCGGIEVLPNALARALSRTDLRLGASVERIDPDRKTVRTAAGETLPYEQLVSTLPLPALIGRLEGAPPPVRDAARGLAATQVLNVNLGIRRAGVTDRHWIYFPEDRWVFYRVGSPTAFCKASAPAGCSSLYIEVARPRIRSDDVPGLVARVKADLVGCGLLRPDDAIMAEQAVVVDPAYVIFDRHRQRVLPGLLEWLRARDIHSVGRYGLWEYGSMEDAIHQGMELAAVLAAGTAARAEPPAEDPCPQPTASR